MTILEALAILETAVLESNKKEIDTPEVREALHLLEPYIQPPWLIPQFRQETNAQGDTAVDREDQHQVLCATFPGVRDSVKDLLGMRLDKLARQFTATRDMKVKRKIERLAAEYGKLKEPWRFVA